jgi:MFS family permease
MPQADLIEAPASFTKPVIARPSPPMLLSWGIWFTGALLYAVGFFQRTAPAVMTNELMADFNITAAALGQLASFFFYAYVLMQIPTGILSGLFGPRKLMTIAAATTALGTFIFASARSFTAASIGLLMTGAAVAMAIVLTLELSGRWFPNRRFALASGLTMVVGVCGAFAAGMPLRLLISSFGWRICIGAMGLLPLGIAVLSWVIVRDDPTEKGYQSFAKKSPASSEEASSLSLLAKLATAFSYRNTWLMLFVPCSLIGAMLSFSGLWGVPYLKSRFGLPESQAAIFCSLLLISFALGSPILGYFSDHQGRRKPAYVAGFLTATFCWIVLILIDALPLWSAAALLVVIGLATGAMPLSYAIGRESAPAEISGIVTGIVITGIMIGPAIIQPITGWILDLQWKGTIESGVRVYDAASFKTAFYPMLGWIALASILVLGIRETYCGECEAS